MKKSIAMPYPGGTARQRGVATLVVSLILLVATTMVVIFTARSAFMEQNISGNEVRAKQAFSAAQAGFDAAYAQMSSVGLDANSNNVVDAVPQPATALASGATYRAAFCDQAAAIPQCPRAPAAIACAAPPAYSPNAKIVSCGWSDDNAARHIITALAKGGPAVANPPTNPLTAKGGVTVAGNISVVNYYNNLTIWTGDDLVFGNNAGKTYIRDPIIAPPTAPNMDDPASWDNWAIANPVVTPPDANLVTTTDKDVRGPDVIETDPTLANITDDNMFKAFMGLSPAEYEATVATKVVTAANTATLAGLKGEVIWVNGNVTALPDLGTRLEPVVLVIDGDLALPAGVTIFGIVYVRGNVTTNGNPQVFGAAVIEGTVVGAGTFEVIYDPLAAMGANTVGTPGIVPGGWRDWN